VVEIDGLHDLHRQTAVKFPGVLRFQYTVEIALLILMGHMDLHVQLVGNDPVQIRQTHVDLPDAHALAALQEVHPGHPMAQIHHAAADLRRAGAADVLRHQRAVGTFQRRQHLQLEASPAEHGPVGLHPLLQHGTGEQIHLQGIAVRISANLPHGIVEEILALLLRQEIMEFKGQIVG